VLLLLLLLLLLLQVLRVLLLRVLGMLGMLLHLLRVLLWMLLLGVLLGMGSRRMRDLLRRGRALSLSRGRGRSLSGRRLLLLLLLRWYRRLRLLGMSHRRLDRRRMMLWLTGLGRRRGAVRSEVALLLLASGHVGLGVMLRAIPVGVVSELCLLLLLLCLLCLLRCWCLLLLQRWHCRRLLLALPCLHVAGPGALLHRRCRNGRKGTGRSGGGPRSLAITST